MDTIDALRIWGFLSLAVLKSISIAKSMLALDTFERAKARTMHVLRFVLVSGSFARTFTKVYSPNGPIRTIVSATDYLLSYPSLSNLTSIGIAWLESLSKSFESAHSEIPN